MRIIIDTSVLLLFNILVVHVFCAGNVSISKFRTFTHVNTLLIIVYTAVLARKKHYFLPCTSILNWSDFEAAKTAPWPSRGLHQFGKFHEP